MVVMLITNKPKNPLAAAGWPLYHALQPWPAKNSRNRRRHSLYGPTPTTSPVKQKLLYAQTQANYSTSLAKRTFPCANPSPLRVQQINIPLYRPQANYATNRAKQSSPKVLVRASASIQPYLERVYDATSVTRATIEVLHVFLNTIPQFGSLRPLPKPGLLEKNKTATR